MVNVLIAGDYSPSERITKELIAGNGHYVLGEVKPLAESADFAVVNFESTVIADGAKPIDKCGPNISCTPEAIDALKYAGFNCVTLANNHFADYGDLSVNRTLDIIDHNQISRVGGGRSIEEALTILYKKIKGKTFAFLNYCEEEFTIATKEHGGSAPLDWSYVIPKVVEARSNADYVLVIIHGGKEFYSLPTPRMKRSYHSLVDMGADAVVNHHQHCYGGYELYKGKPIFYGLGNFCFDFRNKKDDPWNEGYMVQLTFGDTIKFQIIPYYQCNGNTTVKLMNEVQKAALLAKVKELNDIIANDEKLEDEYGRFSATFFRSLRMSLTPYTNRYLYSLCLRRFLPGFISKKRKLVLTDYVNCESWRDIFLQYLKSEKQ